MTAAAHRTMAGIEAEIALTRAELDLTLDALADELAPKRLVEKAVNMVGKSWSLQGAGGTGLGGAIRADAAPLALIGLGVAWLVVEKTGFLNSTVPQGKRATAETAGGGDGGRSSRGNGSVHHAVGEAPGFFHPIADAGGAGLELTAGYIEKAGGSVCRFGKRLTDGVARNPLLFGLAGIVCGAAIAMLTPASRREQELVASAREDLWKRAEDLGHRAADSIRAMSSEPSEIAAKD